MEIRKYIGTGMLVVAFIYLLLGFAHFVMGNETEELVGFLAFNIWNVGAIIIFYLEGKNEKDKTKKVGKRRGQTTPQTN